MKEVVKEGAHTFLQFSHKIALSLPNGACLFFDMLRDIFSADDGDHPRPVYCCNLVYCM